MSESPAMRYQANAEAFRRLDESDPMLIDVRPAGEVVPGMTSSTVLTSGRPMPWDRYTGGQRRSLLYGAIYEGLAADESEAEARFASGEITVGACHEHGCVGSVAGIYTASMPVFVVENRTHGNRAFCNFYEGASRRRLNYGAYDDDVRDGLVFLEKIVAPVIERAVRRAGGIPLKPIMQRAVRMGDELHSRNTAATILFARELTPYLFDLYGEDPEPVRRTYDFLTDNEYSFLRLSMAAAKATADAAHGVEGSSVVSAMTISCRGFALRVSGLDGAWYDGPAAVVEAQLFDGFTKDDIEWIGGESHITETIGLGGFAQAAAFALQRYQGGSPEAMAENNRRMYDITVGENSTFQIPFFGYRGTPTGIDVFKVLETGITPMIDGGIAGRDGGQIGAGILRAPVECFEAARDAWNARYAG
ncbi:MAG: DUF1116 domain-containing protein [Arenicellales bacterium]